MNIILAIIVSAVLDSSYIAIGDQMDLRLQATTESEQVQFPMYGESIIPGVEIVDRTLIDTAVLSDGRTQYTQYLTITSFKDSLFYIDEQPFVCGLDTYYTEGLSLNVIQPFVIDSTYAITDIKDIAKAPVWVWGTVRWILLAIGILLLGVGIYYLVRYIRANMRGEVAKAPVVPARPAEEVALEKLDAIKEQKIWQDGKVKEYHSDLTSVIREYIGNRYGVRSSEKTSDETLRAMKPILANKETGAKGQDLYDRLKKMLTLADLVKFAKWTTTADENELVLRTAYDFVHETTAQVQEPSEAESEQKGGQA